MAVVNAKPARGADGSEASRDGLTFESEVTEPWTVLVDDPATTRAEVLAADDLPDARESHPENAYLRVVRRRARHTSPLLWDVDIDYAGPTSSDGRNPLDQPTSYEWDIEEREIEVQRDRDGNRIVTANNERYEDPAIVPVFDISLVVTKNLPTFDPYAIAYYGNATNADSFLGWPAGTVLCKGPRARTVEDEDFQYYVVSTRFLFRYPDDNVDPAKTWYIERLHQGYYVQLAGTDPPIATMQIKARDSAGEPIIAPIPLDEAGFRLEDDAEPVWKYYRIFRSVSFSGLL